MRKTASSSAPTPQAQSPRVWVLTSYRSGENTQILALAEALGLPFEIKNLAYRSYDFIPGLLRRASLMGIDRKKSSPLVPPWPDLLISAGMRNEPVCRWIKIQSPRTRLVHIGRTWSGMEHFDLIVTTPQYRLPKRPNILHNNLTMHRINEHLLEQAVRSWQKRLSHLPPPYLAVLVGGNSGPFTFGPRTARRLAEAVSNLQSAMGGSILLSTSARTPPNAVTFLEDAITGPKYLYRWQAGDLDNPYLAFLGLAEAIVVTSDSIAMLSEACATGKPVYIFDMAQAPADFRLGATLYKLLMRLGPRRLSRDVGLVHQRLVASGMASWLTENHLPHKGVRPLPQDEVSRTARLIRNRLLNLRNR